MRWLRSLTFVGIDLYEIGSEKVRTRMAVNGNARNVTLPVTGSRESYRHVTVPTSLNSGTVNTVRIESTGHGGGHIDEIEVR